MTHPDRPARPFEKWHGLGNDFVVVLDPLDREWWRLNATAVCDRRRGIGADGVLIATSDPASMEVINADGTRPEMCGNGLRCVAARIAEETGAHELAVRTDAGDLSCWVNGHTVRYAAGTVSFDLPDAGVQPGESGRLVAGEMTGIVASIGNPHWIFLDGVEGADLRSLGPVLETDPRFSARTNVEFVSPLSGDGTKWRVDVWERGVGITDACGTGATAVAATLVREGRAPADVPLTMELPGGALAVTVAEDGSCNVEGPAVRVYSGTVGAF